MSFHTIKLPSITGWLLQKVNIDLEHNPFFYNNAQLHYKQQIYVKNQQDIVKYNKPMIACLSNRAIFL